MQEVCLSQETFISCFQGDREVGQSVSLALVILEETLIQNNQYAIEAHLSAAHSGTQHTFLIGYYILCPFFHVRS